MNNNRKDGLYVKCVLEKTPEALTLLFSSQHLALRFLLAIV
jgi:hypothetical protein